MADARLNNINVDLNKVPLVRCKCGSSTWKIVYLLKKVSALVSPTGKETLVPIQVFACDKCDSLSPLFKNLNDTEEDMDSPGESLRGSIKREEPSTPSDSTAKLFVG